MNQTTALSKDRRQRTRTGGFLATAGVAALVLVVLATVLPAVAAEDSREMTIAERQVVYHQVRQDPTYLAFKTRLRGNMDDRKLVDRYLKWLPISPLQMFKADMWERKYEVAIPRFIYEWHLRWLELHGVARHLDTRPATSPAGADAGSERAPALGLKATVGPNRNAATDFPNPPEEYQGEIQVVVNPADPNQVVAAANTWDEDGGACGDFGLQAVFYSSDGGTTWGYSCPPDDAAYGLDCNAFGGGTFGSDPALYWDDAGNVYLNYMLLCSTATDTLFSLVVARSSDGGATWAARGVVKDSFASGDVEDKNFIVIDNHLGSPHHGRAYVCWDRNNDEKIAYSDDGGTSWTEVDLPTTSGSCGGPPVSSRFDLACEMAVEDDGTVHIIYDTLTCFSSCSCEQMYYSRSTDGGASWSTPLQLRDFNLVGFSSDNHPPPQDDRGVNPFGAIDVDNTGGPCDGTLYVTFTDHTGGGSATSDVWVIRSTDGGASWSSPVLINDDGPGGNCQFHPFLVVDPTNGDVVVAWHDARNDTDNREVDYFVDRSTDCGVSFGTDVQVSAPSGEFNNSTISWSDQNTTDNTTSNPNQYGEYMGLDARGGKAYVAWSDTRHFFPDASQDLANEQENMGFAVVDFGGICPDADGDGFTDAACGGGDCNDADPAINPGAAESCSDGVDNDCDGLVDGDDPDCAPCPDSDGDGFTDVACGGLDCDDSDPDVNPGATEQCGDSIDNDCDGLTDCADGDCSTDPLCSCAPVGAACTVDSDCCSNKCRGPSGGKTCK